MSEWLKEHAWKACVGETLPWVRIPLSPPVSLTSLADWQRAPLCLTDAAVAEIVEHASDGFRALRCILFN
jgi:hypothetical protein